MAQSCRVNFFKLSYIVVDAWELKINQRMTGQMVEGEPLGTKIYSTDIPNS